MTFALVVEPEAEAEINEATDWYEVQSPGLGEEFLRAIDSALATITENPLQYQIVVRRIRRAPVRRFPYGLIYTAIDRRVSIIACAHGSRDPRRWLERLR